MFDPDDHYDDFYEKLEYKMNDLREKVIDEFSSLFVNPKETPVEQILQSVIMAAWEEEKYGLIVQQKLSLDQMEICSIRGDLKEFEKLWIEQQEGYFNESDILDDRCF